MTRITMLRLGAQCNPLLGLTAPNIREQIHTTEFRKVARYPFSPHWPPTGRRDTALGEFALAAAWTLSSSVATYGVLLLASSPC
jgi:hypothetical protein